ncbi:unnamed protein product, partial [marine sediment metagenome]
MDRKLKRSVRVRRDKQHHVLLEDRVWVLLYLMGFPLLSGRGGAELTPISRRSQRPPTQIDVVGIDDEVAVAFECKSAARPRRSANFAEDLGKHVLIRRDFGMSTRRQFPVEVDRQIALGMFLQNTRLSDNDRARADNHNVTLFDETDLLYYEELVKQLGLAAKYQFLADMLPGRPIRGLEVRAPAIKTRMGGYDCYSFAISPEYLLKISYVSHRSKGKPSDVDTYQRMMRKARLMQIKEYITNRGIFP